MGRIPSKFASWFASFTADQWKNWVCYYSIFALKSILPDNHYNVWLHLLNACRLICCKVIKIEECSKAEEEILRFCKECGWMVQNPVLKTCTWAATSWNVLEIMVQSTPILIVILYLTPPFFSFFFLLLKFLFNSCLISFLCHTAHYY